MNPLPKKSMYCSEYLPVTAALFGFCSESSKGARTQTTQSVQNNGTLLCCENGCGTSHCQPLAAMSVDYCKKDGEVPLSIALTTDTWVWTCIANDYNYGVITSRQFDAQVRDGDALVGTSTSGNSEKVVWALRVVKELEIETNILPGKEGGQATIFADLANVIPSDPPAWIQVSDIAINYTPRSTIKQEFAFA